MLLLLSSKEISEIDTSIATLGHTLCTSFEKHIYPKICETDNILISSEFVIEHYSLNEAAVIDILKGIYFITKKPIIYMTNSTDYITFKYNNEKFIRIVNGDIITYPALKLDKLLEDAPLDDTFEETYKNIWSDITNVQTFLDSLDKLNELPLKLKYIHDNSEQLNHLTKVFNLLQYNNNLDKKQLNIVLNTQNNLLYKINILEDCLAQTNTLNTEIRDTYTAFTEKYISMKSKLEEYTKIYKSLQAYGVYNEAISLSTPVNIDTHTPIKIPLIVYFKEYEYSPHFRTLFRLLPSIFENEYATLCKSIILETGQTNRMPTYTDYSVYTNNIDLESFCDNHLWINYGNPQDMLTQLALNEIGFDIYFVWDRTNINEQFILGKSVQVLNLLENIKDADTFKLDTSDIISSKSKLDIVNINNYKEVAKKDKLLFSVLSKSNLVVELNKMYNAFKEWYNV